MGIKKIKIAVVGAGYMVNEHLKCLNVDEEAEIGSIYTSVKD